MAIHCFDVLYSPSTSMDNYLSSWLTSWTAWTEETPDEPHSMTFTNIDSGTVVDASGFRQNRFMFEGDGSRTVKEDAEYIVSNLIGEVGYLASYCDWWMVRHHQSFHDEGKGCDSWTVLDSSDNYSGQTDVPSEVL